MSGVGDGVQWSERGEGAGRHMGLMLNDGCGFARTWRQVPSQALRLQLGQLGAEYKLQEGQGCPGDGSEVPEDSVPCGPLRGWGAGKAAGE